MDHQAPLELEQPDSDVEFDTLLDDVDRASEDADHKDPPRLTILCQAEEVCKSTNHPDHACPQLRSHGFFPKEDCKSSQ